MKMGEIFNLFSLVCFIFLEFNNFWMLQEDKMTFVHVKTDFVTENENF